MRSLHRWCSPNQTIPELRAYGRFGSGSVLPACSRAARSDRDHTQRHMPAVSCVGRSWSEPAKRGQRAGSGNSLFARPSGVRHHLFEAGTVGTFLEGGRILRLASSATPPCDVRLNILATSATGNPVSSRAAPRRAQCSICCAADRDINRPSSLAVLKSLASTRMEFEGMGRVWFTDAIYHKQRQLAAAPLKDPSWAASHFTTDLLFEPLQ